MGLNWNVADVVAREGANYVWSGSGDTLGPITEALIFGTMAVGMASITDANWQTFAARLRAWERGAGPMLVGVPFDAIPADHVRRHVGLRTNASAKSLAVFERDLGKATLEKAKRAVEREADADARRASAPSPVAEGQPVA